MNRIRNCVCMILAAVVLFAALSAVAASAGKKLIGVVNINTATIKQLMLLPGIGEKKAQAIIAYRRGRPFRTIAELRSVKGIGQKLFETLRPHVTLVGATTAKWVSERADGGV